MKKAFTLAEVLITILIIGIIAAITTPIIITNYQKQTCVKKLKKAYSTYIQTINTATMEYGTPENWTYDNTENFAKKYLMPHLQVLKAGSGAEYSYEIKKLNGEIASSITTSLSSAYNIFLTDGTVIGSYLQSGSVPAVRTIIDVNGQKGPNTIGKDVYTFTFYEERLQPTRISMTPAGDVPDFILQLIKQQEKEAIRNDSTSGCNKNASGECCSTLLMENSWEMPEDYPW